LPLAAAFEILISGSKDCREIENMSKKIDPAIALVLNSVKYQPADGDEVENDLFYRLGEMAANDDDLCHEMDRYFESQE
jgi:hypothetical protein